ncbi:MAG: ADP-ribosylglycohydrolase family protein [Nitriliruptoraceae bacterium]
MDPIEPSRGVGALLGTFTGDALGMPFEGRDHRGIPVEIEMEESRLGRGTYTDDTQMMIALAESLVACGRVEEEHLAATFLDLFDPERGYGRGTREVLTRWRSGESVSTAARQLFDGTGSRGNGAAMRIAPVAVRFAADRERLLDEAERSARLTHAHPVGVDAAVVQAAAIVAALGGEDILAVARQAADTDELRRALDRTAELAVPSAKPSQVHRELGSSSDACESVSASICSAVANGSFEDAVRFAIRLGGDTDTTAAMTGAIAGAREGAEGIPSRWLRVLEDGPRGRSHVERLGEQLVAARA